MLGVCSLAIAVCVLAPAGAQVSYQPGQAIQYRDGAEWRDAEFLRPTPSGTQAIVREKNAFTSSGFFERAINLDRIRTPIAGSTETPIAKQAAPQASRAESTTIQPGSAPVQAGGSPRSGDYDIYSYGRPSNPLRLGRINLSGNNYRFFDNGDGLLGQGQYSFAAGNVIWRTGLLKSYGWGGEFKIERGGRTHSIRLNRVTYAMNSR
ncbi:MAG TPA: hypothetical protein VF631_10500 [Allosphingosinicella sp.]|uniref:hypothetical protein n=1 Tax=Allosphingosinicella sp. TaxID=2823234 RepID=UPI002F2A5182